MHAKSTDQPPVTHRDALRQAQSGPRANHDIERIRAARKRARRSRIINRRRAA